MKSLLTSLILIISLLWVPPVAMARFPSHGAAKAWRQADISMPRSFSSPKVHSADLTHGLQKQMDKIYYLKLNARHSFDYAKMFGLVALGFVGLSFIPLPFSSFLNIAGFGAGAAAIGVAGVAGIYKLRHVFARRRLARQTASFLNLRYPNMTLAEKAMQFQQLPVSNSLKRNVVERLQVTNPHPGLAYRAPKPMIPKEPQLIKATEVPNYLGMTH